MTDPMQIFNDALEQTPETRAAFLARACDGDPTLLARLERLVDGHDRAEERGFLRPEEPEKHLTLTGTSIGPYAIRGELGTGAMGVVYLAEQQHPVRRRVALKVVKPGMDTQAVVERFEAERQALAHLDHPHVARVLDAGATESGRPYFVMEYVAGEAITDYCDRHRLDVSARIRLLVQVCHAIQHAHQKGIIHRDIKPSNILIAIDEDRATPKVIDFGVAKAIHEPLIDRSRRTERGQVIGTPEYMSPEQAEMTALDVDTRTDVYSLGVVLYELLSGALPFEPAQLRDRGVDEMRRIIRVVDPDPPSIRVKRGEEDRRLEWASRRSTTAVALARRLRGDLDQVVMKAIDKDRTRRYATVLELAADLDRFLTHRPVIASRRGAGYRARKFARRHRAGLLTGAVVAGTLLVGAISLIRARMAEQRQTGQQHAYVTADRVAEALTNTLSRGVSQSRAEDVASELLDQIARLERTEGFAEPVSRASLHQQFAEALHNLGRRKEAERLYRTAIELRRKALGEAHVATLETMRDLEVLLYRSGRTAEARERTRRRLDILEREFGREHRDTAAAREWLERPPPPQPDRFTPRLAPYSEIQWAGEQPSVRIADTWVELLAINGISCADIIAHARKTYDRDWQERFEVDLVAILIAMEAFARGDSTVTLLVRDPQRAVTQTLDAVPMTRENREAIRAARRQHEPSRRGEE